MSPRNKQLIVDRIAELELEADNARIRHDFKALASFRFLAVIKPSGFLPVRSRNVPQLLAD
ncbi:MAG: hypothetical protein WA419_05155 [Silvibacterium sp.]